MQTDSKSLAPDTSFTAARLGWSLAAVQALIYGSFVAMFVVAPGTMTRPIAPGYSITVAMIYGLCVIFSTIALAGIYVLIANRSEDN